MFEATLESLESNVFKVCSSKETAGMILQPDGVAFLQRHLPPVCSIIDIKPSANERVPVRNDELFTTHSEITEAHLSEIELGGSNGLRRVVGAILQTGTQRLSIKCVEFFLRDPLLDPHAEPEDSFPSSIPTDAPSTQYCARMKITNIPERFKKNRKLVIGVRNHNYLVTSGTFKSNPNSSETSLVGLGRCGKFPVDQSTKLYLKNEAQDPDQLSNDILGLAQVRSGFGHFTTYTARREALLGYGSLYLMPVTIFSLAQYKVPLSRVFQNLALRAMSKKKKKILLLLSDIEQPKKNDLSMPAITTRKLLSLFSGRSELVITGNDDAEKLLSELANHFSKKISNMNLKVAKKIYSETNGP